MVCRQGKDDAFGPKNLDGMPQERRLTLDKSDVEPPRRQPFKAFLGCTLAQSDPYCGVSLPKLFKRQVKNARSKERRDPNALIASFASMSRRRQLNGASELIYPRRGFSHEFRARCRKTCTVSIPTKKNKPQTVFKQLYAPAHSRLGHVEHHSCSSKTSTVCRR